MAAETVDTLELVISASASKAAENVRALATSVTDFGKGISSYINNMVDLANVLERIANAAKGVASIKGIRDVIGKAARAASTARAATVGKAFEPIVPPLRPSGTVKGGTKLVNIKGTGAFRYSSSSDEIARDVNRQYGGSSMTNKALSAKIQEIRQMVMNGDEQAMKELTELAGEIARSAGAKRNISPMIAALNGEFAKNYIGVTDKDIRGTGMSVGAMNALAKSLGGQFRFKLFEGNRNSYGMRGLDEMNEDLLRSVGVSTPNVEDLISAMQQQDMHGGVGHRLVLDENYAHDNQELQTQIFDQLIDKIYAGEPVDIQAPAKAAAQAMAAAKQAADEAARIVKEESEAWKSQTSWNREQDARYKEEYGGKEKKWQMEAAWREHDRMNAPEEDFTAQEIAAWKAEMIKEEATIGPTQDMQSFVDDMTGVSRETKSAQESARVFISEMEYAGQKTEMAGKMAERLRGIMQESAQAAEKVAAAEEATRAAVEGTVKAKAEIGNLFEGYSDEAAEAGRKAYEAALARQIQSGLSAEEYAAKYPYSTPEASGRSAAINYGLIHDQESKSYFAQIAEDAKAAEEAQRAIAEAASQDPLGESARVGAGQTAEEFMESVNAADLLQMKLEGVGEKLEKELGRVDQDPAKIARLAEQYQKLSDRIRECGEAAEESGGEARESISVWKALGNAMKSNFIGKTITRLFKTAQARAFRAVVRSVAAALKEGVSNLYQWSKANNGHFASAMDNMKTKLLLMKNSVAAAVSPLIESFIPVIVRVANVVNLACNVLSQFFALLTGQKSWMRATESAQEWAEATGTGAGNTRQAAKEAKDLLADWDELNIIQQEANDNGSGSGGGSGTKTPNYSEMFEEVSVFDDWTKKFEQIRDIVLAITAGIAAWSAANTIGNFLKNIGFASDKLDGILANVKKGIVGAVLLTVGFKFGEMAGKDFANNGFSWEGLAEEAISLIASGLGGAMLASAFGINPVVGLALGVGLSIYATISSYEFTRNENAREYIRQRLEDEVYHFDVKAEAEKVDVTIANAEEARKSTRSALQAVMTDMELIRLGVDTKDSWTKIYNDVFDENDGLLAKVNKELEADDEVIKLYYEFKRKTSGSDDGESDGADTSMYLLDMQLTGALEDEYTKLGKKLAECFNDGENATLKAGMEQTAQTILETLTGAERAAEEAMRAAELKMEMEDKLKGTDAKTVIKNMPSVLSEFETSVAETSEKLDREMVTLLEGRIARLRKLNPNSPLIEQVQAQIDGLWQRIRENDYGKEAFEAYKEQNADMIKNFVKEFFPQLEQLRYIDINPDAIGASLDSILGEGFSKLMLDYGLHLEDFLPEDVLKGLVRHAMNIQPDEETAMESLRAWIGEDKLKELFGGATTAEDQAAVEEAKAAAAESASEALEAEAGAAAAAAEAKEAAGIATKKDVESAGTDNLEIAKEWAEAYKLIRYTGGNETDSAKEAELFDKMLEVYGEDSPIVKAIDEALKAEPDTSEQFTSLMNKIFGGEGGDTSWFTGTPAEPVKVNATESGMAMDSTVTNLSNVNGEGFTTLEGIMKTLGRTMEDVAGNTKALVGKNWTLIMSPSSGLGGIVQRGAAMYNAVTG